MCEYGNVNPEHWRYLWDLRSSCLHRTCGLAWRSSMTYACHTQTGSSREAKPDSALAHHQQIDNAWFTLTAKTAPL
jgi:hypothetical protein